MADQRQRVSDNVRIGPVSVLALIAILSMAVLAVLAISTANASLVISQRQATAVSDAYLAEAAAQDFVAELDGRLAGTRGATSRQSLSVLQGAVPEIVQHAQDEVNGLVTVEASVEGAKVKADFSCVGARTLSVEISVEANGSLRIEKWAMTAVQNTEQSNGDLWMP